MKDITASDVKKRFTEAEQRLAEFGAVYTVIQNEKNKYVRHSNNPKHILLPLINILLIFNKRLISPKLQRKKQLK